MHLDPVKAGGHRMSSRQPKALDDGGQLVVIQLPWHHVGLFALGGVHFVAGDRDGAGRHRLAAAVEQRMAGPAPMPDLQHDAAAGAVHGIGREPPTGDLGLVVDARFMPEGRMALHHHRGFGHDQAGAGPLGIVLGHQRSGHMALLGAAAGQRRHPDAVGQRE